MESSLAADITDDFSSLLRQQCWSRPRHAWRSSKQFCRSHVVFSLRVFACAQSFHVRRIVWRSWRSYPSDRLPAPSARNDIVTTSWRRPGDEVQQSFPPRANYACEGDYSTCRRSAHARKSQGLSAISSSGFMFRRLYCVMTLNVLSSSLSHLMTAKVKHTDGWL